MGDHETRGKRRAVKQGVKAFDSLMAERKPGTVIEKPVNGP
jgi:hypothetical protein